MRYSILLGSALAALAQPVAAHADTAPPAANDSATVNRLIKLLVGNGIISQKQADALADQARAGLSAPGAPVAAPSSQKAAATPPSPSVTAGQSAEPSEEAGARAAQLALAPGYRGMTDPGNRYVEPGVAGKSTADPAQQTTEAPVEAVKARIAESSRPSSRTGLKTAWNRGSPLLSTSDGFLTFRVRGQLGLDIQSTTGSRSDARNLTTTGARELRIGIEGTIGSHFYYMLEPDFLENRLAVQGAFVGYRGKVFGHDFDLRAGNVTLDRGLEYQTGVETQEFTDRSTASFATLPQINYFGLGLYGRLYGSNWHVSASVVGDQMGGAKTASDSRVVDARFHWNPIKSRTGLIHVGGWVMDEALSDAAREVDRNTAIGGRFNDNLRVSTGPLPPGKGSQAYGLELLGLHRNKAIWAEYATRKLKFVPGSPLRSIDQTGWSVSGSLYLTGETPSYSARTGTFSFPVVKRPVFDGGPGGIELVARYEEIDYSDAPQGGTGNAATLGANWYLTNWVRLTANAIRWHTNNQVAPVFGPDSGLTFLLRSQIVW